MTTFHTTVALFGVLLLGSCTNVINVSTVHDNSVDGAYNHTVDAPSSTYDFDNRNYTQSPGVKAPIVREVKNSCNVSKIAPLVVKTLNQEDINNTRSESELLTMLMTHNSVVQKQVSDYNAMVRRHNVQIKNCNN